MDYEYLSRLSENRARYNTNLLKSCGINVYVSDKVEIRRPWLIDVGHNVMVDSYFVCTTALSLAGYNHIGPHCSVCGGEKGKLFMSPFSGMSSGCRIVCGSDDFVHGTGLLNPTIPDEQRCDLTIESILFQPMATIGVNVTVLPGVTLGMGSMVGAGAVVTQDTAPWTLYAGIPARPIATIPYSKMIEAAKELGYDYSQCV